MACFTTLFPRFLLALVFVSSAAALPKKELPLQSVLESANKHHPLILASQADIDSAKGEVESAKGAFDFLVKGEISEYASGRYTGTYYDTKIEKPLEALGSTIVGGYREGSGKFPDYDDYYRTEPDGEFRLGFELPLLRNRAIDKRRTQLAKTQIGTQLASLSLDLRRIEILRQAAFAYWEWVAACEKYRVFESLYAVAKERDSQLLKRGSAGDLAQFDHLDNQRQLLQRENQLLQGLRARKKSEFDLALFYRDQEGNTLSVEGFRPPAKVQILDLIAEERSAEQALERAYRQRPDLVRLDNQLKQQELELTQANNELLPKLDFRNYLVQSHASAAEDRDEVEYRLGLSLEVPLENRVQRGRVSQFSAKVQELRAQKIAQQDRIQADLFDALAAIEIFKERWTLAKREHAIARDLEAGERVKFLHGDSNLIFVNLREQTTADAAIREIDALLELNKSVAQYHAFRGDLPS